MFKNVRTSTKLIFLCGLFVVSIVVATYGLVTEKQIAIEFVRKELIGTRYLEALRGIYSAILTEDLSTTPNAEARNAAKAALDAVAVAEGDTAGSLNTAESEQALTATLRELWSSRASSGSALDALGVAPHHALVVVALGKARDLASRIGDDSNLALDPDLDSYYLQDIVVTKMTTLLSQLGQLQSLLHTFLPGGTPSSDRKVRPLILDGMIRSTIEGIERNLAAAYRGDVDGHLRQAIDADMTSMISATESYLKALNANLSDPSDLGSLDRAYASAVHSAVSAWTVSQAELGRLLNKRLTNLLNKLRSSLMLNGLVAGLSIVLALVTHRHIVRPLAQLEGLADKVRKTKDYSLRINYDSRDEIGRLAVAFNGMLAELATAREREISDQARTAAMQAELARVARLTTMGEMTASIAHEINQPLAAVVTNANAGLRWLNNQPPNLEEARAALKRIVNDGGRGSDVIGSIRAMLKKGDQERAKLDINDLIREVMILVQSELKNRGVSIQTELVDELPHVLANRIQLQQVILNLTMNAVEAMVSVSDRARVLYIRSEKHDPAGVLVTVEDSGTGIDLEDMHRIFETFFTTKSEGMGMGLSICRSIVEAHGGRISASRAHPHGTVFQVVLTNVAPSGDS